MPEFKSFSVKIDSKTFTKESKKLLKDLGSEELPFVREQSAQLARDLAKFTPPYDGSPKYNSNTVGTPADIRRGMNAVKYTLGPEKDSGDMSVSALVKIRRKRKTINDFIKRFGFGPIIIGGKKISSGVIDDMATLQKWHYMNRGARGRLRKIKGQDMPIVHRTLLNKYIKRRLEDVGIAKAGFYKASLQVGAKAKAPPAVKRNVDRASGSGRLKKTKDGWVGVISSSSKGAFHVIHRLPKIEADRNTKAAKRLRVIARELVKKTKLNG